MPDNRTFRITQDDIEDLRERANGRTSVQPLIEAYEFWISRSAVLDFVIGMINDAFQGQTLGDGIGLLEAHGIDDYAGDQELAALRLQDEHLDWRCVKTETLNRCYAAPTFLDARGFIFYLPAFLIAELNDEFDFGFIDRLFDPNPIPEGWVELLTHPQRESVIAALNLVSEHPDYHHNKEPISMAISRIRNSTPMP